MRVQQSFYEHHHHTSVTELGHLLTRSGLTYTEVSSKVYHDSFCQLESSISLPWVIYSYFEAFYLHVVSSFSYSLRLIVKCTLTDNTFHYLCKLCKMVSIYLDKFSARCGKQPWNRTNCAVVDVSCSSQNS